MSALEDRVKELEGELAQLRPSIHDRLTALESTAEEPGKTGFAGFIAWMGPALPQFITGLLVVVVVFLIKDSVDLAIREQQLRLSFTTEMQPLLVNMARSDASLNDIKQSAVLVATFGRPAIMPLLNELSYEGNRRIGAEIGLRSLALSDPDVICKVIPDVVASRARILGWEEQMILARILAVGNCYAALPTLRRQATLVTYADDSKDISGLNEIISDEPAGRNVKQWRQSLQDSISTLEESAALAGRQP